MAETSTEAEIRALQEVIKALEPLDEEARNGVLDYTLKRLGMREVSVLSWARALAQRAETQAAATHRSDERRTFGLCGLRSSARRRWRWLRLSPTTFQKLRLPSERKDALATADLEKYFKQANYRLRAPPRRRWVTRLRPVISIESDAANTS